MPRIYFKTLSLTIKLLGFFQSAESIIVFSSSCHCLSLAALLATLGILRDGIQSAFLLEKEEEATTAELTAVECLEHQKIPSSFPKDELHIAQIIMPQILVTLSGARQPSPCPTIAWQR